MTRSAFTLGTALGILVAFSTGCLPDRDAASSTVYACNPASTSADDDCGAGYVCYTAAQALGSAMCVPRCDPAQPASCAGLCTAAGECLRGCTVGAPQTMCPDGLHCIYRTYGAVKVGASDGVCLPVNAVCSRDADCTSPVFNRCPASVLSSNPDQPLEGGSFCVQGDCEAEGSACQPGSSCLRRVLGAAGSNAPDLCMPNCLPTKLPSGQVVDRCLVGFTCLSVAFPESPNRSCAPGFPGWLCIDPLGCVSGDCTDWGDVDPRMAAFRTCTPGCTRDDDCVASDQGNPSFLSKYTCHAGKCRSFQSLFFPTACDRNGDACLLDPRARCRVSAPSDGGAPPSCGIGSGTAGSRCVRVCASDEDCRTISEGTHLPHTCRDVAGVKECVASVPVMTPCVDASSCLGNLGCEDLPTGQRGCTIKCSASEDCTRNPVLGSAFACALGLCLPKTESGCAPQGPLSDLCLSGAYDTGRSVCISPSGWSCDDGAQCGSGRCERGRCE